MGLLSGSSDVRVIHLSTIEERLAAQPVEKVLHELADTDSLLSIPTAKTRCALVSYRQERGCGDPSLTLDGHALLGVLATAKRAGMDFVWIDGLGSSPCALDARRLKTHGSPGSTRKLPMHAPG
eukprot:4164406-Prymnesium_polylepis.1